MKNSFLLYTLTAFLLSNRCLSQSAVEKLILQKNQMIDEGIIKKNISSLDTLYASDFVFTHGTGLVDSKKSWLQNVSRKDQVFISRAQDSTTVELHPDLAIVVGRLLITRSDSGSISNYGIWYVRVFSRRVNVWQLVSHKTTKEWHY